MGYYNKLCTLDIYCNTITNIITMGDAAAKKLYGFDKTVIFVIYCARPFRGRINKFD